MSSEDTETKGPSIFNLTAENLEEWWNTVPDKCFYCGMTIDEYLHVKEFIVRYAGTSMEVIKFKRFYKNRKHQAIRWMTIDRVKNDIGYQVSNIVKCCWICNSLKNDFFDEYQMRQIAPPVVKKLRDQIEKETA